MVWITFQRLYCCQQCGWGLCGRRAPRYAALEVAVTTSSPLLPAPSQSVLSIILGGDKQWLVRVSTVAGVVVLRTLLQVRSGSLGGYSVWLWVHVRNSCRALQASLFGPPDATGCMPGVPACNTVHSC